MANEELIMEWMEKLKIADKHTIGKIAAEKGLWKEGTSAVNNSYKALMTLVDTRRLLKGDDHFKLPNVKSEYKPHAQLITEALTPYIDHTIYREHVIDEVGLRPDAIILETKENKGRCLILEVADTETEKYLESKRNTWKYWDRANEYLSELFGYHIPFYTFKVWRKK